VVRVDAIGKNQPKSPRYADTESQPPLCSKLPFNRAFTRSYVPIPINFACCGLPPPLSNTETSPVRLPLARGLNVTFMEQLAPEATLLPHVLVSAKSPASVPVIPMPVIFTAELPLFVSVIFLARLLVPMG
jgi:hypothetical protein